MPVRFGFFSSALQPNERFDVIIFNDVIEHVPDIKEALRACAKHLDQDGILALNLPNSRGIFYRASKLLASMGATASFERMWQYGFPSPHVHYFSRKSLEKLVIPFGFEVTHRSPLPFIISHGLLERISYGSTGGRIKRLLLYAMILAAIPFLRLLPTDIHFFISKRNDDRYNYCGRKIKIPTLLRASNGQLKPSLNIPSAAYFQVSPCTI